MSIDHTLFSHHSNFHGLHRLTKPLNKAWGVEKELNIEGRMFVLLNKDPHDGLENQGWGIKDVTPYVQHKKYEISLYQMEANEQWCGIYAVEGKL